MIENGKPIAEEVIREFPPVGKYRIRLLSGKGRGPCIDIREYVSGDSFEGFTRRGVRLSDRAQIDQLQSSLKELLDNQTIVWKA